MPKQPSRFVGADVTALRRFAGRLDRAAGDVERVRRNAGTQIDQLKWSGPDHDQFVDVWRGEHAPSFGGLAADLRVAADLIRDHARRQAQVSGGAR